MNIDFGLSVAHRSVKSWYGPCLRQSLFILLLLSGPAVGLAPAAAVQPPDSSADNLLKNPGFEAAAPGGTLPADWEIQGRPDLGRGNYTLDTTVFHGGKASLKWVNTDPGMLNRAMQWLDITPTPKDRYECTVWIRAQNLVRAEREGGGANVQIQWYDEGRQKLVGWYTSLPNVGKDTDWTQVKISDFTFPPEAKAVKLVLSVNMGYVGTVWFDDVDFHKIVPPALSTFLLEPAYRGWISDTGPARARVRVKLDPQDHGFRLEDTEVKVFLDGQPPRTAVIARPAADVIDLQLPLPALLPGDYNVEIGLIDRKSHKILQTDSQHLKRLPAGFAPRIAIDQDRRVVVAGKPFFPLGMFTGGMDEATIQRYSDSAFNTLLIYGSPAQEMLDRADRHGIKVIYSLNNFFVGAHSSDAPKTADEEEKLVRDHVRQFKDHPALLAWYLNDELPPFWIPQIQKHNDWVIEEDKDHPTYTVLAQPWTVSLYPLTTDVIGCDPYPIPFEPASIVGEWTRETVRETEGVRAVWMAPQGMNWAHYYTDERRNQARQPSLEELRSMSWQAICEGATGLVYYTWEEMDKNPGLWDNMKQVASEIKPMEALLLSNEPCPALTLKGHPGWVHTTVRRSGARVYVFAANDGDNDGAVSFTLAGQEFKSVSVLGDPRHVASDGHSFTDNLAKFAVRTYVIDDPFAG